MKQTCSLTIAFGGLLVFSSVAEAATRYAKVAATGTGDCLSWADACTLGDARAASNSGDQIWVKAGTYPRFDLKQGVQIIGGFAGTETSASQSNPTANVTIVDGGGTKQCVKSANHSAATVLRGFSIRSGHDTDDHGGGGLSLSDSSAMIVQCTFENNTASILGGAVVIRGNSSPQFVNCIFRHNGATARDDAPHEGGAVFLESASATFTNCLFHDNKAGRGGAFAMSPGGGAVFTNCTFANNQATWLRGGAVSDPSESLKLRNCILWGNTRVEGDPPAPTWDQIYGPGDGPDVRYSDVQGGWSGMGNINAHPQFLSAAAGAYGLQATSPCKNTGDSTPTADTLPPDAGDLDWDTNTVEPTPKDLGLLARIRLGTVDMGAYEIFDDTPPTNLPLVPDE
ncbi:MAG: right-handed parallel beta-helix repeat-containing protein [Planctomycetota bacterium]